MGSERTTEIAALVALAESWERKHQEHTTAAVDEALRGQEGLAGLQFAAGSVRALCAEELRAAIGRPLCLCDAPDYGIGGVWCEVHPNPTEETPDA